MSWSERIKAVREARGWSQTDLARFLQIRRQPTISEWEKGKYEPSGPARVLLEMMERDPNLR